MGQIGDGQRKECVFYITFVPHHDVFFSLVEIPMHKGQTTCYIIASMISAKLRIANQTRNIKCMGYNVVASTYSVLHLRLFFLSILISRRKCKNIRLMT